MEIAKIRILAKLIFKYRWYIRFGFLGSWATAIVLVNLFSKPENWMGLVVLIVGILVTIVPVLCDPTRSW